MDNKTLFTIAPQTVYCRSYNLSSIAEKTNLLRDTALEAMRSHGTDTTKHMYFIEYSIDSTDHISYCVAFHFTIEAIIKINVLTMYFIKTTPFR